MLHLILESKHAQPKPPAPAISMIIPATINKNPRPSHLAPARMTGVLEVGAAGEWGAAMGPRGQGRRPLYQIPTARTLHIRSRP